MDNPIANKVVVCLQSFQTLCSALLQPNLDFSEQIPLPKVKDELSRFKVWSGNIGAHRSGRSSLDYRLRDASHLRKRIIDLLEDLNESLGDAISIVLGETTPWDETSPGGDIFDRDNSEEPASNNLIEDSMLATTELNQILLDIIEVVNCLLRLSVAIRNPAPHDRLTKSKSTDTSHYEPYDIQHVCTKFPNADEKITARLGKAISRRRQYFKYREEHHNKLSQGLDFNSGITEIVGPSTIASSLPQHIKGGAGVAGDLGTLDEDERSETGISQTSYATSVADSEKIRVPPLPKQSKDGPFECPFCFMIISASTPLSWKKHVFKDLRPYICLWKDCLTADQEFLRRHEWMEHVMQKHWRTWHCAFGCKDTFPSASEFKQHIPRSHNNAVATTQLDALASLSERRMALDVAIECPLCAEKVKSVKQYRRHVGRHQEELALFALPKITGLDEVEAEQHDSQGQPIESIDSGNPGQQSDSDRSGLSSASAAAEYLQQDEQDGDNPVMETDGNSGHGVGDRSRTDYDDSVTKEQWLESFGNEDDMVEAADEAAARAVEAKKAREEAEAKAVNEVEVTEAAHEKALTEAKATAKGLKKAKKLTEGEAERNKPKPDEVKAPIKFRDAVGRKFSFPWRLCKTWKGMEELIKQAFLHIDIIGPHVHDGHYDLVGPDGEIILPQVWETVVQPGWAITMHMWPIPEPPPPPPPPPEPPQKQYPPPPPTLDPHIVIAPPPGVGKKTKKSEKITAHHGQPQPPPMMMGGPPPPPPPPADVIVAPPTPPTHTGHGMVVVEHHAPRRKKEQPISPFLRWTAGGASRSQPLKEAKKPESHSPTASTTSNEEGSCIIM